MPRGIYEHKKGHKHSEETKKKIKTNARIGGRNNNWKGDEVGYKCLHKWIYRQLGKAKKCSVCGKEGAGKGFHWANIDHEYRRNVDDFMEMCCKCHAKYDKENNFK